MPKNYTEEDTTRGDAYKAVRIIYDRSPGKSWRRLNGALSGALSSAIEAHLSFKPDDFAAIARDMKGGYWMGSGSGVTTGERYYSLMVKLGHTPACISFESFAGRPPALWIDDVKTPARLHVGSRFAWDGYQVEVTSMDSESMIACWYEHRVDRSDTTEVGDGVYVDREYRRVESIERKRWAPKIVVRLGEVLVDDRKPTKRFKISYSDLAAKRKEFDATRRLALDNIEASESVEALDSLLKTLQAAGTKAYRRYDQPVIVDAIAAKRKSFEKSNG